MHYIIVETKTPITPWVDSETANSQATLPSSFSNNQMSSPPNIFPLTLDPTTCDSKSINMATSCLTKTMHKTEESTEHEERQINGDKDSISQHINNHNPVLSASPFNVLDDAVADPTPIFPQLNHLDFASGNPSVEITQGVIHLYHEPSTTTSSSTSTELSSSHYPTAINRSKSKIICIIAVPAWLVISDLCQFLEFDIVHQFSAMRILRDHSPNKYMAAIRFKTQSDADNFYMEFNGKPYSSMSSSQGPEICHLAYVKRVDFVHPKTTKTEPKSLEKHLFPSFPRTASEIPTCPVCLERLDSSTSGLLTILCKHTFHCNCLIKWKEENTCPVCRHMQHPSGDQNQCLRCHTRINLWICLLCGHLGCSRYRESHAHAHYLETLHNYALEIETQRVWDYAGDGYVHRIIRNKTDGKLVEVPSPHSTSDTRSISGVDSKEEELEKLDAVAIEYQYLITAQLDTQRTFYERQIQDVQAHCDKKVNEMEAKYQEMRHCYEKAIKKSDQLETEKTAITKMVQEQCDQLRDLMLYIEAQNVISNKTGELVDGQVVLVPNVKVDDNPLPKWPELKKDQEATALTTKGYGGGGKAISSKMKRRKR